MCLGFPLKGWSLSAKNTGSYKEPVYTYQALNKSTGETKVLTDQQYNKSFNLFKKSRRK